MYQLTNGPMDQWTNGPMDIRHSTLDILLWLSIALILFKRLRATLVVLGWVKIWKSESKLQELLSELTMNDEDNDEDDKDDDDDNYDDDDNCLSA